MHSPNPNHAQADGIKGQLKGEFVPRYLDWAKLPLVLGRAMVLDYTVVSHAKRR